MKYIKMLFKTLLAIVSIAIAFGIFGFTMGLVYAALKVGAKFGAGVLI